LAIKLSVVNFCKRLKACLAEWLPCGAILIDGSDFLDQKVTPPAIRPSKIAQLGDP
jgi:hypothetical protein